MVVWEGSQGRTPRPQVLKPGRSFVPFRRNAKKQGNHFFTDNADTKQGFWASPGPYLRRSTLTSLARNISGCERRPPLLDENTFETDEVPAHEAEDMDLVLSLSFCL